MAKNPIQFQKGLSLPDFFAKNETEEQCNKSHRLTSLIAGTIFDQTKLPLTKGFLAIYFSSQNKNGISALKLKRI